MLIAGNWKMNGLKAALGELNAIAEKATAVKNTDVRVLICPPATLLSKAVDTAASTPLAIGAQVVSAAEKGAFTGDISAEMVADIGATHTIVGHSERRMGHAETDTDIAMAAKLAQNAGLHPIVCCGESLEVREAGDAVTVITTQLSASLAGELDAENLSVAYEPIWAIGSGKAATAEDINDMHNAIRAHLIALFGERGGNIDILYGGSVKGSNAEEILAIEHVGGALVGGASLTASDFGAIIDAACKLD